MAENLDKVYDELQKIMKQYVPPFTVAPPSEALKKSGKRQYALESVKDVVIAGRPRDRVYFAGIVKQKGYVGFYYMLIYAEKDVSNKLSPEFLALLKGKTCFYIRSTEPWVLDQVKKALDEGVKEYKSNGWVNPVK